MIFGTDRGIDGGYMGMGALHLKKEIQLSINVDNIICGKNLCIKTTLLNIT